MNKLNLDINSEVVKNHSLAVAEVSKRVNTLPSSTANDECKNLLIETYVNFQSDLFLEDLYKIINSITLPSEQPLQPDERDNLLVDIVDMGTGHVEKAKPSESIVPQKKKTPMKPVGGRDSQVRSAGTFREVFHYNPYRDVKLSDFAGHVALNLKENLEKQSTDTPKEDDKERQGNITETDSITLNEIVRGAGMEDEFAMDEDRVAEMIKKIQENDKEPTKEQTDG